MRRYVVDGRRLVDFRMAVIVLTSNLGTADPRPAGSPPTPCPSPTTAARSAGSSAPSCSASSTPWSRSGRSPPPSSASSSSSSTSSGSAPAWSRAASSCDHSRRALPPPLGHDPRLGARPLRRTIEDLVVAPIAERIAREPTWRDPTVRITTSEEPGDLRV